MSLASGKSKIHNLHAIYGEFGGKLIDRDQIEPKTFSGLDRLGKKRDIGLDFNCKHVSFILY